jgi:hypothetical protein
MKFVLCCTSSYIQLACLPAHVALYLDFSIFTVKNPESLKYVGLKHELPLSMTLSKSGNFSVEYNEQETGL